MRILKLGFVIALLAACATATTIIPMSVEELTQKAGAIVEGRAMESWSEWNPQHTIIYTYTRFQVARTLKGQQASLITVKQLGGIAGGYAQKVDGVRHFQAGEDALLFLRNSIANDGKMVIVGLMQGQFRMYADASGQKVVSNGIPQLARAGEVAQSYGAAMPLVAIEQRIAKAMTK
ncbi:MAG: hypothetical protein JO041_16660 [Acidobacteria bacterium]|nr:hypothetical protein [Acidobacteriota bacterium]